MAMFGYLKNLNAKYETAMSNIKALQNEKIEYVQTVEELKRDTTAVSRRVRELLDSLDIKPKKVIEYKYLTSTATKLDTVNFKDTIFIDSLCIDTAITSDPWYSLDISLKYPSDIVIKPTFKSEKFVVTHVRRETINPPRKFFLFRWFQRKHTVIETEVVESNPYIVGGESKFIEVRKRLNSKND
jgi:hypothetical protein